MIWLLDPHTYKIFQDADPKSISVDQQLDFEARMAGASEGGPRILDVAGDTARIRISGVLTPKPDYFARYYGGGNTTYREVIEALDAVEAEGSLKRVEMYLDTPGGSMEGLFNAIARMQAFRKPIKAVVDKAASAGYAIASQAGEIVATGPGAILGSMGTRVDMPVSDNIVTIANTDSPNKAPDVKTEEGKAAIRETLDEMYALFVDAVAKGRNTTVAKINANYGQGGIVLAEAALKKGMIDAIAGFSQNSKPPISAEADDSPVGKMTMTLDELKAKHLEVYQAVLTAGINQERERVQAHAKLGKASGALDVALKAIEEGTEFNSASVQADYMVANMNRKDRKDRKEDDEGADPGSPSGKAQGGKDDGDETLVAFQALKGAGIL